MQPKQKLTLMHLIKFHYNPTIFWISWLGTMPQLMVKRLTKNDGLYHLKAPKTNVNGIEIDILVYSFNLLIHMFGIHQFRLCFAHNNIFVKLCPMSPR